MDISTQPWFEWIERQSWLLPVVRKITRLGFYVGKLLDSLKKTPKVIKINIVGDLSLQSPDRLEQVMAAAKDCDFLVQVGDMHPGYDVVKAHTTLAVPGNHDIDWGSKLDWPRQWRKETSDLCLIGLDNSQDSFSQADYDAVNNLPKNKPVFIIVHKPLSPIVLPDGTLSTHDMGEGSANADAVKMQNYLCDIENLLLIHGHYHGLSFFKTNYADCLIEGRGGAAPTLGYSSILVTPNGWTIHSHDV